MRPNQNQQQQQQQLNSGSAKKQASGGTNDPSHHFGQMNPALGSGSVFSAQKSTGYSMANSNQPGLFQNQNALSEINQQQQIHGQQQQQLILGMHNQGQFIMQNTNTSSLGANNYNPVLGNPGQFLAAQVSKSNHNQRHEGISMGGMASPHRQQVYHQYQGTNMTTQHQQWPHEHPDQAQQSREQQQQAQHCSSLIDTEDEAKHIFGNQRNPVDDRSEGSRGDQQISINYRLQSEKTPLNSFIEKVFLSLQDSNQPLINTFEDCRHKLETLFEDNFQPERDYLDHLQLKRERNFEDYQQFGSQNKQSSEKSEVQKKRNIPSSDDQDLMPMDLDEDHNLPSGLIQQFNKQSREITGSKQKHEEEKTNSNQDGQKSYFDRCKQAGRIGPVETKLDSNSSYGDIYFSTKNTLEIEAMSSFSSIRASTGVFAGRYYYEVMLKTSGLMQIGWCTLQTTFNSQNGVGDDNCSYAYDGYRIKKWHGDNLGYGEAWSVGDVIGTLIDFDRKVIQFWRNKKNLGKAFTNIKVGPNCVYFPAISFKRGQRVVFNFGRSQLNVPMNISYGLIDEPWAEVNNYSSVAHSIITCLKQFLVTYYDFQSVSVDQKLAVGSILIEYLYPLILDDYLLETQLLQFLEEVVIIRQSHFKSLIFDLFSLHMSSEQLKVFIQKLMRFISKKIMNTELIVNNNNRPSKQDHNMTFFQLLIDLIERDEFLYAWLVSDFFFDDLEAIFEMHMPSQTDWDTFFSMNYYHEYLPGKKDAQSKYLKSHYKAQAAIEFTQQYWFKLTAILIDRRKRQITSQDVPRVPFDRFRDFLHHIASRSTQNPIETMLIGNNRPHKAGLNNNHFLINVFTCFCSQIQVNLMSKPVQMFPFHCFFMRDGYDFDEGLKQMDRIGGSFTHLESELSNQLKPFKGQRLSDEEKDTFIYAKDLLLIAINGILPEMEQYTISLDQMYMNHRKYLDLTQQGRIEKSSEIFNDMSKILRQKLQNWRLSLQNKNTRDKLMKFSIWLLQLINHIDQEQPDLIYILPDYLIQIPFELLRMMKRESQLITPTGVPICNKITGPGQNNNNSSLSNDMSYSNFDSGQINSSSDFNFGQKMQYGMVRTQHDKDQEERFFRELVTFISKHHIDDRIANPDLKEMYLVRLNVMLQHNHFIQIFQEEKYAQEHFITMMMKSFIKNINLRHVTKNILRLAKGQGFKEIIYEENVEKTQSQFFLNELRKQLLNLDNKVTNDFMNAFFNSINDITSELFIIFKELKNNFQQMTLRKTQSYFQTSVDLLRMCELFATWCPELFLDVNHVHSSRLMNFIMFVMNSVFIGEVNKHIIFFSEKVYLHSATLEQFLAPIIGILVNLYMGILRQEQNSEDAKRLNPNSRSKYESLTQLFDKINAFNEKGLEILNKLREAVWPKFEREASQSEHAFIGRYDQMLQKLELLIRKKEAQDYMDRQRQNQMLDSSEKYLEKLKNNDGKAPIIMGGQLVNEDEFEDEDLCQICCRTKQDTQFVPCQHQTCKICIKTHLLNNEKCPFCNAEIQSLKDI